MYVCVCVCVSECVYYSRQSGTQKVSNAPRQLACACFQSVELFSLTHSHMPPVKWLAICEFVCTCVFAYNCCEGANI